MQGASRAIYCKTGFEHRQISGAAAGISRESRPKRVLIDRKVRSNDCLDRGNHPRRAVRALRCVMLDHRLLDRAEAVRWCPALNRDDVSSIELLHHLKTTGNGAITQAAAIAAAYQNGARTAVALATADLGADQATSLAQEFDQRAERVGAANLDAPATQINQDMIRHTALALDREEARDLARVQDRPGARKLDASVNGAGRAADTSGAIDRDLSDRARAESIKVTAPPAVTRKPQRDLIDATVALTGPVDP